MMTVPNRPFSSELITGLMLPDGIFESTLGKQVINAYFKNQGAVAVTNTNFYIESTSHPAIVVQPDTKFVARMEGGASRLLAWEADFSNVPAGVYYVSFVAESGGVQNRTIKKIFVTKVQFDPTTKTFSAQTPEGTMEVKFRNLVRPKDMCCGGSRPGKQEDERKRGSLINDVGKLFQGHDVGFQFCPPGYLPLEFEARTTANPPFTGQYGDLPFQDPWWKIILCIIAVLLLIAAAIVAAVTGQGSVSVSTNGGQQPPGSPPNCCGVHASGGSGSYVVAGLVAAAAAAATAAGLSDVRDPWRRGQDHTMPAQGELTVAEEVAVRLSYPEPVALGKPFAVKADWKYRRITTGASYDYSISETNTNIHVASDYKIHAPNVVRLYRREPFIVAAEFFDKDGKQFRGDDLFVQCILSGPQGQYRNFVLQDDGNYPDQKPTDGTYTGIYQFALEKENARGLWMYYVIAQDVNHATPDMKPDEAAQYIGGMVLTHQLTISFQGGTCPLVPDGDVNVI
jgi:hypothetical protein